VQARLGRRGSFTLLDDLVLVVTFGAAAIFTTAWPDETGGEAFRPIDVNGGPFIPKAYGFFFVSSGGVGVLFIALLLPPFGGA
jgi:hypothetical protein